MRLGINTVLWFWPFDTSRVDVLKKISDIGFEIVEFALVDRSSENVRKIRNALEKTGLICVLDGVVGDEKDILSPDRDIREEGYRYLFESVDLCVELGSDYLIGPIYSTGIKKYLFDDLQRKRSFEQAVSILNEVSDYAEEHKIKIAIEPLNRYETNFINTTLELKGLIESINRENTGFQLDTFHANIEEKNIYDAIMIAGEKLFHMHAPESDRGTLGTGLVDWNAMFEGLRKIGYGHNINLEIAHPHVENIRIPGAIWRVYDHEPDEMARKGFDFLKGLLK
ncbi:MAG: sugar phosphate isomerase/epimerase [Candidatus Mariimomonas ferrooxydans]